MAAGHVTLSYTVADLCLLSLPVRGCAGAAGGDLRQSGLDL